MGAKSAKSIGILIVMVLTIFSLHLPSASAVDTLQKAIVNKDGQLVEMDVGFLTNARMAGLFVFDNQGNFLIPSYIKSSNGNYYSMSAFTNARMASSDGAVTSALSLLNNYPSLISNIAPSIVKFEGGAFDVCPILHNTSVGGIAPVITGTTEAPILTFTVVPTATYTAGTATLSENVSYVIHNAFYDITGTATTTENLMNTALALIGLHGGDNFNGTSVRGSTLISNSPLTITLTGASGATVYTISFVAAP
ncbi:MAG: hypothetical protein GX808_01750 [Syntrophomonadaceae bacterium]|nr:hypothetical protein [Syntrophomonadaceae bacterium]